jgi:hypothetical protein
MAADLRTTMTAIRDALRAAHTVYDLSTANSTPRVYLGEHIRPPVPGPCLCLWVDSVDPEWRNLSQYQRGVSCLWRAWVQMQQGDDDSVQTRHLAALDMVDDVLGAIETDAADSSSATYKVIDLRASVLSIDRDDSNSAAGHVVIDGALGFTTLPASGRGL